jgi:hypothetical protein
MLRYFSVLIAGHLHGLPEDVPQLRLRYVGVLINKIKASCNKLVLNFAYVI